MMNPKVQKYSINRTIECLDSSTENEVYLLF